MTLAVIIPVYRSRETLKGVIDGIRAFAEAEKLLCRLILVEDHGCDGSLETIRELASACRGITGIALSQNCGQQYAIYCGLAFIEGCSLVATMDDDGLHPARLLRDMMKEMARGVELCYAIPVIRQGPFVRRAGAAMRDMLFSLCLGKPRGVRIGAYRMMTAELAGKLRPERDGFIYLSASAFRYRPKTTHINYEAKPRKASSYTPRKLAALYLGLLTHYTFLRHFLAPKNRETVLPTVVYAGKGYLWEP